MKKLKVIPHIIAGLSIAFEFLDKALDVIGAWELWNQWIN